MDHRVSVFRIVLYGVLAWFFLAFLWMALPCPAVDEVGTNYATKRLKAGKTLTRIYGMSDVYSYLDETPAVQRVRDHPWRSAFALDFSFDASRRNLQINDIKVPLVSTSGHWFVSETLMTQAKAGDQDGINPPWFSHADSTLLFWWIHRDIKLIPLRIRWTRDGDLEIWPEAARWEGADPQTTPTMIDPLLTIKNAFSDDLEVIVPPPPISSSPSSTYHLRVLIANIIVPTGLLVVTLLGWLGDLFARTLEVFWRIFQVMVLLIPSILVIRCVAGRQRFQRFTDAIRESRHAPAWLRQPRIWGASGPVERAASPPPTRVRSSQPIRGIYDFFSSSSPLDDLLKSFEMTKHLTQPLGRRTSGTNLDSSAAPEGWKDRRVLRAKFADRLAKDLEKGELP